MTGALDMGYNAIIGICSSAVDNAALTVGGAKATYLSLLGNRSMQGILNMGGHAITNIKPFVEDDSKDQKNEVINFNYFHTQRGELKRLINETAYEALNRKDPDPMQDDINMANHSIINLKDPQAGDNTYAATVNFVHKTINDSNTVISTLIDTKIKESETRSIESIDRENVFKKVMNDDEFKEDDDDLHKVGVKNKNFHKVNHQTYEFKIDYDSNIGYYSTRLAIDLMYLPIGSYTMVYEMYIDDGLTVDEIDASSGTLTIGKINSRIDGTKTRSIIHITKYAIQSGYDDLEIGIKLKGRTDPQTTIYVVVYGVKGQVNDVSVNLWDRYYYYDNDNDYVKYKVSINMNNKDITGVNKITTGNLDVNGQIDVKGNTIIGVGDGTENSDAVNKAQLDIIRKNLNSLITILGGAVTKNRNDITTINVNDSYYFFTNELKHDNNPSVRFPSIDSYPYKSVSDDNSKLRIFFSGHYHIIYTDFYKNHGQIEIYDDTNSVSLFVLHTDNKDSWTPIIINAVVPIQTHDGFGHADIKLQFSSSSTGIFDGTNYSTFYIKYMGP